MGTRSAARETVQARRPVSAPASPLGRRERNKLEKRTRIVAAARRLFAEKGFAETTTLEIAEAADIGTGTLFLYARSKEDLLILVFQDEMIEEAAGAFAKVRETDALADRFVQVFATMMSYHERDTEQAKVLLREIMFPVNEARLASIDELMTVIYSGLEGLLNTRQRRGRSPAAVDTRTQAENLFAIYYFVLLEWLGGKLSRAQAMRRLRRRIVVAIGGDD